MVGLSILVTGSNGLIGSELIPLLKSNYDPICLDKETRSHMPSNEVFIKGDLLDVSLYPELPPIEGIIHLAAVSRVIHAEQNPLDTWETNVHGTALLLRHYAKQPRPPWVIYGSSREIYGEPQGFPVSESHPLLPINRYGETKLAAEALVAEYVKQTKTHGVILRFSNVYGNLHDHFDRVIPKFIIRANQQEPLHVHGATNTFDFTHVSDTALGIKLAVDHLVSIAEMDPTFPPSCEAFNICTGVPTTLEQLARIVIDVTGSNSEIIETKKRSYDVQRFYGDYSKAQTCLGYSPKTPLKEGIKRLNELLVQTDITTLKVE